MLAKFPTWNINLSSEFIKGHSQSIRAWLKVYEQVFMNMRVTSKKGWKNSNESLPTKDSGQFQTRGRVSSNLGVEIVPN